MSAVTAVLAAPFSRRMRRESAYLLVSLLPAVTLFALALLGIVASLLSVLGVGLPVLATVLALFRSLGAPLGALANRLIGWRWEPPVPLIGGTPLARVRALFVDGVAWRGLLYGLLKLPLTAVSVYLGVFGVVVGALALTAPLWYALNGGSIAPLSIERWSGTLPLALQGLVVFLLTPWFVRLMVAVDRRLAFGLLAGDPSRLRIAALEVGRRTLQADATTRLQRIERNLHDGTQARLVLLGLSLARLEARTVDGESLALITSAQRTVSEAMLELREVIRGVRPPALDDSLSTALSSLVASSPVPVTVIDELRSRPSDAAATAMYFATAELLSNLVRYSQATAAEIRLSETADCFELSVEDNGVGGAGSHSVGTGLHGLQQRAEALDGALLVSSPVGGPTAVALRLPKD